MGVVVRLEFDDIFDEEKQKLEYYLENVASETLLLAIGFLTIKKLPNYDNFFSNTEIDKIIKEKIHDFIIKRKLENKPSIVSREACLVLAETILKERKKLIEFNKLEQNPDRDEINLFKCFLVINEKLKKNSCLSMKTSNNFVEDISLMLISVKFSTSDIGLFENDFELLKIAYTSAYKIEELLSFLNSNPEFEYLIDDLCNYFNVSNQKSLLNQVKYLLLHVLSLRIYDGYKFSPSDQESINFLDSLISENILAESDFIHLRNNPIYKIDDNSYSIVDPYFVMDKFTKSVKFILKESYDNYNKLDKKSSKFFSVMNKRYSEEYLMINLLNRIFNKKYYLKQEKIKNSKKEPDFYFRHDKNIFLFEYKDVLIPKEIKSNGDIDEIINVLKEKFLYDTKNNKDIGIGQLVNHILDISNSEFSFDKGINLNKKNTIYPILLLSDRMFEIPGLNYIMNIWFREKLNLQISNNLIVKNLILMDIDTFIFYEEYFTKKEKNFKAILDEHIEYQNMNCKGYGKSKSEFEKNLEKKVLNKISPLSSRLNKSMFDENLFVQKFLDVVRK